MLQVVADRLGVVANRLEELDYNLVLVLLVHLGEDLLVVELRLLEEEHP